MLREGVSLPLGVALVDPLLKTPPVELDRCRLSGYSVTRFLVC